MKHWIFISSPKQFRMHDWLASNEYVEYLQRNKVEVNDIIYLYTTAPVQRIEYKMIVDKINVPFDEIIDDSAYQLHRNPRTVPNKDALYVRLKLIKKVDNPLLHLNFLRGYGLRSSMQSALTVSGDLLDYIETKFQ
jgi:5-methylcytosine-specific restriction protein A